MIAIIDYNVGNLHSAQKALAYLGCDAEVTDSEKKIRNAKGIVIPGVGAFPDAMERLRARGLDGLIREEAADGKPVLGICLGMQLLFDGSDEVRPCGGLSLIPGRVRRIRTGLKIPHMGWNDLHYHTSCPLFRGIDEGKFVYFVHSFCADTADEKDLAAYAEYGERVTAAVFRDNVFGTQFHPEKSSGVGLKILKNFMDLVG